MTAEPTGKGPGSASPTRTPQPAQTPPTPLAPETPGMAQEHEQARKRLQSRRDLSAHAVVYVVVNALLVGIWALTGQGYFWPIWIIAPWGVGLVLNAWDVLWRRPITEADIQREMRRGRGA